MNEKQVFPLVVWIGFVMLRRRQHSRLPRWCP